MAGRHSIVIATAGWSIPRASAAGFPSEGSLLARYAQRFNGAEINSTFYRSHRASTYARWRDSVPEGFRFSVKVPKTISHEKRLENAGEEFSAFLAETAELGDRRGPLLLQLPPALGYDESVAVQFFAVVRRLFDGPLVVEPRHPSWFADAADALLNDYEIGRVGADPPRADGGRLPGGFPGLTYLRLHGTPRVYFSSYDAATLLEVMATLHDSRGPSWCVFDNTASGAAAANALALQELMSARLPVA